MPATSTTHGWPGRPTALDTYEALLPYAELSYDVAARDNPFVTAIRTTARNLERKPRRLDWPPGFVITAPGFEFGRSVSSSDVTFGWEPIDPAS